MCHLTGTMCHLTETTSPITTWTSPRGLTTVLEDSKMTAEASKAVLKMTSPEETA
nr:unnamed protein product [Callosobruchus analis]